MSPGGRGLRIPRKCGSHLWRKLSQSEYSLIPTFQIGPGIQKKISPLTNLRSVITVVTIVFYMPKIISGLKIFKIMAPGIHVNVPTGGSRQSFP